TPAGRCRRETGTRGRLWGRYVCTVADLGRRRRGGDGPVGRHAAARRRSQPADRPEAPAGAGGRGTSAVRVRHVRHRLFRFRRGAVHPRPGRGLHRGGPRAATGGTLGVRGDASDALDLPGRPGPGWSARHQFVFRPHPVCGDRRAGPGDVRGVSPHARRLHPCTARCRVRPGRSGRTGMAGGSRAGVGPVGPGAWRVVPRHRDLPLRAGHMSGPHSAEITATLADGRVVGGRVYRLVHGPQDLLSRWNARGAWDVAPAIGDAGAAGMDAALSALAGWLRREVPTTELSGDTAVQVTWPSHDVAVFPVLLAHGLVPTTVLATRPLGLSTLHRSTDVRVRKATMS